MSEIFLSWSKDRSFRLAKALSELITYVLRDQAAAPDPSKPGEHLVGLSTDLPKGESWFTALAGILEHARAGIICVTPENRTSPWLLFEAGALIRCDVEVALFPVLLDLPAHALEGPLALIQGTVIEREPQAIQREIHDLLSRVVKHVNSLRGAGSAQLDGPLPQAEAWERFVTEVLKIEPATVQGLFGGFSRCFSRKTFREPFQDCADQRWLERYAAASLARHEMEAHRADLDLALPPGSRLAYERLSGAADSYAMAIGGLLLRENTYPRDAAGRLLDESGALAVCERRRRDIEAAYLRLVDPTAPVFDDARTYEELGSTEERKRLLIHPLERRLEQRTGEAANRDEVERWRLERAKVSSWQYDRIVYYLHGAHASEWPALADLVTSLDFEISHLEALDEPDTLVGLYYALDAVDKRARRADGATVPGETLERIEKAIVHWNRNAEGAPAATEGRWDRNFKVRRLVRRLRLRAPAPDGISC